MSKGTAVSVVSTMPTPQPARLGPLHMIRRPRYEEDVKHKVWEVFREGFPKGKSKYTVRSPHYALSPLICASTMSMVNQSWMN